MKKFLTAVVLLSLTIISCKKEDSETTITPQTTPVVEINSSDSIKVVETTAPVEVQNPEANMMMQAPTNLGGINPAHGQPGHRCEIPVGAPLNSAPKAASTPTVVKNTAPAPANSPQLGAVNPNAATNTVATQTAPGMNPPHGQAGHSCSVAVGAPLPKTN